MIGSGPGPRRVCGIFHEESRVRSQCSTLRFPRATFTHLLIPPESSSDEDTPGPREIGLFTTNMLCKYEGIALALARTRVK